MTTIAWDGVILATDSLITISDRIVHDDAKKLFRLKDGRLAAFAGNAHCIIECVAWLESKREAPPTGDYTILVVMPDGKARCYEDGNSYSSVKAPYSRGSGGVIALTAMRCGKTAVEAVRMAIELDVYSGGRVQSASLRPAKK